MERRNILALDYGKKRMGLATGDLQNKIAFPKCLIANKGIDFVLAKLDAFCEEWEVGRIVVGLPLNMDSSSNNEMVQNVKLFVADLRNHFTDIDIELFDERLSSFEADSLMKDSGDTGNRDAYAAQVILQRYFDAS